jgi:sodium/bile acid cotransporter 7
MRRFFVKRWFLLLLVAGGLVVWLQPGWVGWVRWIDPRLAIAPALFLTAWGLPSRRLYQALLRPMPALWATAISYGFLPTTAWLAARLLPAEDLGVGLIIISVVPCTLASALLWTRFAGGNEATSLLIILFTTCTSFLFTTAWLSFAIGATVQIDRASMMSGLFLVLVIPVGLGQGLRASARMAQLAETHRTLLGVLSRLFIFTIMLRAALDTLDRLGRESNISVGMLALSAGTAVAVHTLALGFGFGSSRLLRFERAEAIAVAFSSSQKTLPVALFLFDAYFKDAYPLAVVPMVFYHVGQLVVDTFIADELGRKDKNETLKTVGEA